MCSRHRTASALRPFSYVVAAALMLAAQSLSADNTYVRVKSLAPDRDSRRVWSTNYGSFEKEYTDQRALEIFVRNSNRASAEYVIRWYFIAKPLRGRDRWIYDAGEHRQTLEQDGEIEFAVVSKTLKATDEKYSALDIRHRTGGKYAGWFVTITCDGEQIKEVPSKKYSRQFREAARKLIRKFHSD